MFKYSVVSEAELAAYKQRTTLALNADKPVDPRMRAVVEAFLKWPHIATVWAFTGEVRLEGEKYRTRRPHSLTFVCTEAGLPLISRIAEEWQKHELHNRMQITTQHLFKEDTRTETYPAWVFRLNYRPEPDVVESVMKHWLAIAVFTNNDL
ncbi:hypothetical protein MLDJOKPK_00044 [Salmonella phage SPAsTU]|nr:hypothetical protein STsAS_094 [Salmonella phage STsAS]AWN08996.1 hypothetical protein MLDJOKPK_00044 [Salmonella phage SPAsTU]